jgi:hypothetical protein
VTGDHNTMMREHPHDENVARLLSDAVARHCAKPALRAPPSGQTAKNSRLRFVP